MLIGPTLPQPLTINIEGDPLSRPYIIMTQTLMQRCGAQVEFNKNQIVVKPGRYRSSNFTIERDWSAAAFWMSFGALANKTNLLLKDLRPESMQGDISAIELFSKLGIKSTFEEGGLRITKQKISPDTESWNFRNHPDLVQPAIFAAAGLQKAFTLNGLDNLRLKETDRIAAIENELQRMGVSARTEGYSMTLQPKQPIQPSSYFESYDDHRMVMSIAPMSLLFEEIRIENPMVVAKSYPEFWKQVEKFVDVRPVR